MWRGPLWSRNAERMKLALAVAVLGAVASSALAEQRPRKFRSFKLVNYSPSGWSSRKVHAPMDALVPQVDACGPYGHDKAGFPALKLVVAANGDVESAELTTKALSSETIDCITKVVRTAKFSGPGKVTTVKWALYYGQ